MIAPKIVRPLTDLVYVSTLTIATRTDARGRPVFTYVALGHGYFKVGKTYEPGRRLIRLRQGHDSNPSQVIRPAELAGVELELDLVAVIPGDCEQFLLGLLRRTGRHAAGEWFHDCPDTRLALRHVLKTLLDRDLA